MITTTNNEIKKVDESIYYNNNNGYNGYEYPANSKLFLSAKKR